MTRIAFYPYDQDEREIMRIYDKYDAVKKAASSLRSEMNRILKPKGFKLNIKTNSNYYYKYELIATICTPNWFDDYTDPNDRWSVTPKLESLRDSITKRFIHILHDIVKDMDEITDWVEEDDVSADIRFSYNVGSW